MLAVCLKPCPSFLLYLIIDTNRASIQNAGHSTTALARTRRSSLFFRVLRIAKGVCMSGCSACCLYFAPPRCFPTPQCISSALLHELLGCCCCGVRNSAAKPACLLSVLGRATMRATISCASMCVHATILVATTWGHYARCCCLYPAILCLDIHCGCLGR